MYRRPPRLLAQPHQLALRAIIAHALIQRGDSLESRTCRPPRGFPTFRIHHNLGRYAHQYSGKLKAFHRLIRSASGLNTPVCGRHRAQRHPTHPRQKATPPHAPTRSSFHVALAGHRSLRREHSHMPAWRMSPPCVCRSITSASRSVSATNTDSASTIRSNRPTQTLLPGHSKRRLFL